MGIQKTLKAMADPTRREILELLRHQSLTAGEIAGRFAMSDAAVSKHLSVLKDADLVRSRRDGRYIIYELNASVLEEVLLWIQMLKGDGT